MKKRTFDNLTVDGEDLIIAGDIEIHGVLTINNANLIVSGAIEFVIKKSSTFVTTENSINITNGSISAKSILDEEDMYLDVFVENGDIYVADELSIDNITLSGGGDITCYDLNAGNIDSVSDIIVNNDANVQDVTCFNYLVSGDNDSVSIVAIQDIYILGDSDSCNLQARDIFIGGIADLNGYDLTAFGSVHIGKGIFDCEAINVGR